MQNVRIIARGGAILIVVSAVMIVAMAIYVRSNLATRAQALQESRTISPGGLNGKVDFAKLATLPAPVERYFRIALTEGQPFVRVAHWKQIGQLATSPADSSYLPFQAEQFANARKPAFLWNARVSVAPVLFIRVADSYADGIASGSVYLLSAIPIANRSGEKELNQGALFRYLAEGVWYPTALLPANGVEWQPIDARRALATLSDSGYTASLEFRFSQDGLVQSIYTRDRPGLFDGKYVSYPWEGRFRDYRKVDGMMIPFHGEVGWHLPDGFWLFWKGDLEQIQYKWQ